MKTLDLVTIIGNLSQSLYPVQHLISAGAYLLGLLFFITAISKLRTIADRRASSSSQEKMFAPMMYLLFGAILLYLPTALVVVANTTFGVDNVLTYTKVSSSGNIYHSMGLLIRTAGLLWFVRGCVLVTQASQPGTQQGPKGLMFMIAGVFAINFDSTIAAVNSIFSYVAKMTLAVKASQGF